MTSACVTKSVRWPPHSLGTARVRKPSLEPFLMISQSNVSRGSAISSRSGEVGGLPSSATLRAVICQARCSLLRVKSIGVTLSSLGRQRRRVRPPAVACQRLCDTQFRLAAPHSGMEADACVLYVFVQRHVAHYPHGAEAFGRVLYRAMDRLPGEYGGDGGERQIREAAVGEGVGEIRRPGGPPDPRARDLQPDPDLGKFYPDP